MGDLGRFLPSILRSSRQNRTKTIHHRTIGVLIDVALIAVAAVTIWRLASRTESHAVSPPAPAPPVHVGGTLPLAGIDWRDATRHIVLLANSDCPACQDSGPFYVNLSARVANDKSTHLVVASTEALPQMAAWTHDHGLFVKEVLHIADFSALGISVIPATVWVDSSGVVTDLMVRRLAPDEEDQVWRRLSNPARTTALDNSK